MAELKVLIVHNHSGLLAAGESERNTEEVIVEEPMRIVGAMLGFAMFSGMDCAVVVTKTGTFKEMGSYAPERVFDPTDFPMFYANAVYQTTDQFPGFVNDWKMLRASDYFKFEKGDRFYAHFRHHNGSTAGTNTSGCDVVLFYY